MPDEKMRDESIKLAARDYLAGKSFSTDLIAVYKNKSEPDGSFETIFHNAIACACERVNSNPRPIGLFQQIHCLLKICCRN